jgi:two-component system chemotaxis response regulator CheB
VTTNVLIVDDSATARLALRWALESDPEIRVVGEAADRAEALELVAELEPDLVTMDVMLRHDDGIDVAAALMTGSPVPILIVTGRDLRDPQLVYQTMEAGALDVFPKLPVATSPEYDPQRRRLVRLVKALAGVHVVRRRPRRASRPERGPLPVPRPLGGVCEVALLGASTGGPPVLAQLLERIPAPAPLPIVVVQHMAMGFAEGFASWLSAATRHCTRIVEKACSLEPGVVYLAPSDRHLVFTARQSLGLSDEAPRFYQRPSVDVLFETAAVAVGGAAIAVLLTGMGRDGAAGLAALKRAGAYTIAQEPASCAVASMPETAIAAGAVEVVLPPDELAQALATAVVASAKLPSR